MSRAHMLYDDSAMSALPVKITNWKSKWNPSVVFKQNSGNGFIIEAKTLGKSKHCIVDGVQNNNKYRYISIHLSIIKAVRRKFDQKGEEIEPDFGSKKKVNTGYLMSSFKDVNKEGEDNISAIKMKDILHNSELEALLDGKLSSYSADNISAVWCDESQFASVEIGNGAIVRLRTKGDGCYLESIVCLDEERTSKVNYTTGESVGGSWTDKVLNTKDEKSSGAHLTTENQAVDDDEWDD